MNNEPNERVEVPTPWIDLALRILALVALLVWSLRILLPFLVAVLWGGVLAIALYPLFLRVAQLLGQRTKLTAGLFVIGPLALLLVPSIILVNHLLADLAELNAAFQAGTWTLPPPPAVVETWPVVGERLYSLWQAAHNDLTGTITELAPELGELQSTLIQAARSTVFALVNILFSLIVMAAFFVSAQKTEGGLRALLRRLAGREADRLLALGRDTIRSVARGIVGVAAIQATLGGCACLVAGVPGAGIWTLVMLVLAVAQLPVAVVLLPIAGYLFLTGPMWIAVVFLVWSLAVSTIDNVLKPILLGQGVDAPLLVIFLGAIGGLLSSGVIGLFLGPVILVLTFTLVDAWARTAPSPPVDS